MLQNFIIGFAIGLIILIYMRYIRNRVTELQRIVSSLRNEVGALRASQKDSRKSLSKRMDGLEESVGTSRYSRGLVGYMLSDFMYGIGPSSREAKPFTLMQKVEAIMDHLGLTEVVSATTKLVKKPEPKPKKTATATEAASKSKRRK